jgi:hypothetical protein
MVVPQPGVVHAWHAGGCEVQSHLYCGAGVGPGWQLALHTSMVCSQPGVPLSQVAQVQVLSSHLPKATAWQFTAHCACEPPHPGVEHGMHFGGTCVQSHEYDPPAGVGAGGAPHLAWQIARVSVQPAPCVHFWHAPSTHFAYVAPLQLEVQSTSWLYWPHDSPGFVLLHMEQVSFVQSQLYCGAGVGGGVGGTHDLSARQTASVLVQPGCPWVHSWHW